MAVPFMKQQGNPTSEQTLRPDIIIRIAFQGHYHSASCHVVVSRHCIFDMNVYHVRRELALSLLCYGRHNVG